MMWFHLPNARGQLVDNAVSRFGSECTFFELSFPSLVYEGHYTTEWNDLGKMHSHVYAGGVF